MRTIDVDAFAPLLIGSTLVVTDQPWLPPRLELVLRTELSDGVRLRFHTPTDLQLLAGAIRNLLADHRRAVAPLDQSRCLR